MSTRPGGDRVVSEGAGSYGAGLARFLADHGETVFEVGHLQRERRSGGKTDALDAVRAARSVLGDKRPAQPRAKGEREALRALMAARDGAVTAKTAALSQLRDLLVTAPEPLRAELRPLSRARLLAHLAATRPDRRQDPELRGTHLALKTVARRIRQLTTEERALIDPLLDSLRPQFPGLSRALPGDTLFARQLRGEFDVVLALYHDQGLAPLKAVDFDEAVNVTLGLPHVRTSPDHGTAFSLAGQGRASPRSFANAVETARRLIAFRTTGN